MVLEEDGLAQIFHNVSTVWYNVWYDSLASLPMSLNAVPGASYDELVITCLLPITLTENLWSLCLSISAV